MDKLIKPTGRSGARRQIYSPEFKRSVLEESFKPGASVRAIARRYGISSSALYRWRFESGPINGAADAVLSPDETSVKSSAFAAELFQVHVMDETAPETKTAAHACSDNAHAHAHAHVYEIEFDRARLRFHGAVSASTLRVLIQELSR